jgi:Domain of unknown function (DUF4136)
MSVWTLLGTVLIAAAPTAEPVAPPSVSYDRHADASGLRSYRWAHPLEVEEEPLVHQRLVAAIDYHLRMYGLRETETEADVWVTYHSDSAGEVVIDTGRFGYTLGPGWYWGGGLGNRGRIHRYPAGTLVVDVWDATTARLLWRGTAPGTVTVVPERPETRIGVACATLFRSFPRPPEE